MKIIPNLLSAQYHVISAQYILFYLWKCTKFIRNKILIAFVKN